MFLHINGHFCCLNLKVDVSGSGYILVYPDVRISNLGFVLMFY